METVYQPKKDSWFKRWRANRKAQKELEKAQKELDEMLLDTVRIRADILLHLFNGGHVQVIRDHTELSDGSAIYVACFDGREVVINDKDFLDELHEKGANFGLSRVYS